MITEHGYSKDLSVQPEGIAVTFGRDMIEEKGGLRKFLKWFEYNMQSEDGWWLHKLKNCPRFDVAYVYIIIEKRFYARANFVGYSRGAAKAYWLPGAKEQVDIPFPHIMITGPLVKPRRKIAQKGFQGFRYTTKIF